MKFKNGAVYKHQYSLHTLVQFPDETWGVLHLDSHPRTGMTSPAFLLRRDGKYRFTEQEMINEQHAEEWVQMDGNLRIEKSNGHLLPEETICHLEPLTELEAI